MLQLLISPDKWLTHPLEWPFRGLNQPFPSRMSPFLSSLPPISSLEGEGKPVFQRESFDDDDVDVLCEEEGGEVALISKRANAGENAGRRKMTPAA